MYILGRDTAIEMRIFLLILLHVLSILLKYYKWANEVVDWLMMFSMCQ